MDKKIDFNHVYEEFHPKILRYLSRLAGHLEAEDIAQEVFDKVNRSLDGFKGKSKLSTWIYRIATNAAFDRIRSASFKHSADHIPLDDGSEVQNRNISTGDEKAATDQTIIRKEMSECVREYIDKLPPDYRTVILLSEIEGFKNREIADILGVTLDTVKIRLHRARSKLREELDNGCDFYHSDEGVLACDRKPVSIVSKKSE